MAVNKGLIIKLFSNVVHYLVNENHKTMIFNDKITNYVCMIIKIKKMVLSNEIDNAVWKFASFT